MRHYFSSPLPNGTIFQSFPSNIFFLWASTFSISSMEKIEIFDPLQVPSWPYHSPQVHRCQIYQNFRWHIVHPKGYRKYRKKNRPPNRLLSWSFLLHPLPPGMPNTNLRSSWPLIEGRCGYWIGHSCIDINNIENIEVCRKMMFNGPFLYHLWHHLNLFVGETVPSLEP